MASGIWVLGLKQCQFFFLLVAVMPGWAGLWLSGHGQVLVSHWVGDHDAASRALVVGER